MEELEKSLYRFAEEIDVNRGLPGQVVRYGKPIPEEQYDRWARALGWKKGTPEYAAFIEAADHARALAPKKGRARVAELEKRVELLEKRAESAEGKLAKAREQLVAIRHELVRRGIDIGKLAV